ncbi:MAG TPA: glycosyltransferase [Ohtaekwangia sp.]|uniref:glycosyltransferase n=1 Tax=Ohtaekwangia sp. TaxID=2066019 RepID=UPI002F94A911
MKTKRRIAFISEHASPLATLGGVDSGGQNVYVGELARHLVAKGYHIDIYTRWDNRNLPMVVNWMPQVRIVHIEAGPVEILEKEQLLPYMPQFTENMLRFIQQEGLLYTLVHANFFMSAMVASGIKAALHIPFVVTFHALGHVRKLHQGDSDRFPAERVDIEKRIVQEADHIIAECPQDQEDLIHYYEASPKKISVVPCGFNPQEFYPIDQLLARMVLSLDASEYIILQLGRMVPRKGVDNVVRALAKVRSNNLPVRLLIVGGETETVDPATDKEIGRLHAIAREAGVEAYVTFAGRKNRDVLKYYYAAADVFITTPWYEPFGITPLESMACGTPVVGSEVGGIKYTVKHGETGFLVPPNDPDALALRISQILTNATLAESMRRNAIKRVNATFTWAHVADAMNAIYDRLLLTSVTTGEDTREQQFIQRAFEQAIETFALSKDVLAGPIREAADLLAECFMRNKKTLVCGNGGSAAESQHLVAELVGRFELPYRKGLPAIALTADSSVITAWANDIGYEDIFARQVEAYGQKGDVLVCFSTSGMSPNIVRAMKMALDKQMYCIALSGKGGGEMWQYAHVDIVVPSNSTQRVQEMHLHLLHTICSLVETKLFNLEPEHKAIRGKKNGQVKEMNGSDSYSRGVHRKQVISLTNEESSIPG